MIGSRLYAVLGCTQLDSTEALNLGPASETWVSLPSLGCPRHLPGVTRYGENETILRLYYYELHQSRHGHMGVRRQ